MALSLVSMALMAALPAQRLRGQLKSASDLLREQTEASQPAVNLLTAADRARVDLIANETLASTGVPSVSLAVVRGGKLVYVQAYGAGRYRQGAHSMIAYPAGSGRHAPEGTMLAVPARTSMRYSIGSNTKQFTAAAVLLLQEQGKLSVDDPVAKYFPELTRAREITLRMLLSHTSGYQDDFPQDYIPLTMQKDVAPDYITNNWAQKPLDYEPGTKWQYSNTGFIILGRIVEKVSGQPYLDFVQQHVLRPVGIEDATSLDLLNQSGTDAVGYTRYALGPPRVAPHEGRNWAQADGILCMTAEDLARWDISFMDQTLLKPASYAEMTTEVKLKDGSGTGYGFGLDVGKETGADGWQHRTWSHSGEESGFLSQNYMFPDDKTAVVVLTNADYSDAFRRAATKVAAVFGLGPGSSTAAKTTEEVRGILDGLTAGTIDRSLFTANANGYFNGQVLADFKSSLAPLGPVVSLTQRGPDRLRGGMTFRAYTLIYSGKRLTISTYWMPDGKIEQYLIETTE